MGENDSCESLGESPGELSVAPASSPAKTSMAIASANDFDLIFIVPIFVMLTVQLLHIFNRFEA